MPRPKTKSLAGRGADAGKNLARRSVDAGKEHVRAEMREASGRDDSPEGYGGDAIEDGAHCVSERAVEAVRELGAAVKDKAAAQFRERTVERIRQRESPDSADAPPHEPPSRRQAESMQPDAPESASSGPVDAPTESPRRAPPERPEPAPGERIKTRDAYIRAKGHEGSISREVREPPSGMNRGERCHIPKQRGMPQAADAKSPPSYQTPHVDSAGSPRRNRTTAQPQTADQPVRSVRHAFGQHAPQFNPPAPRAGTPVHGKGTIRVAEKGSVKTAPKAAVKTAKGGAVKTAETAVKTAGRSVKTAERAAQATARATEKAAHAAAKAAQAAAKAAHAAAQAAAAAAKTAAQAAAAALKALAAAAKSLIAAIAAGGWVAIVIVLAVALVAVILCACFGVFAANETEDGSHPMTEAILEIDTAFRESIDAEIAGLSTGDYDEVSVRYAGDIDGDSDYIINWNDVIAVYSVRVTMDESSPTDVAEVTPEKIEKLRETFLDMNTVLYETQVIETEGAGVQVGDGSEEETAVHRKLEILVTVTSADYLAAAELYAFNSEQMEALNAMMEPQMASMYAELLGVDLMGGFEGSLTDITSGLPAGEKGTGIVSAALTRLGHPYSQERRGEGSYVDCSYLTRWAYEQAGISLPGTSAAQAEYCADNGLNIGQSELAPGDLVFWSKTTCNCGRYAEIHHVGIYIGDGRVIEASASMGRVVIRSLWGLDGGRWQVHSFARIS